MESVISSLVESLTASETTTGSSLAEAITATTTEWLSSTFTSTSTSTAAFPSATDIDVGLGAGGGVAISEGNPVVNFLLGIMIVLGASVMNAFGLNLTKLDHVRRMFAWVFRYSVSILRVSDAEVSVAWT